MTIQPCAGLSSALADPRANNSTTGLPRRAELDGADGADQAVAVGSSVIVSSVGGGGGPYGRRRVGRHRVGADRSERRLRRRRRARFRCLRRLVDAVASRRRRRLARRRCRRVAGACPARTPTAWRRSSPRRCRVVDGGGVDSGTVGRPAPSTRRLRRAAGLLDRRRARRHQRAQLHDAGDVDGVERVALVAHAGQVDDDVLTLDANVGFGDAASFELVADQVTNAVEIVRRGALLRRQHDRDAALQVEAEHRLVAGDEVDGQQHDGDDDDPDERDPQTTADHSSAGSSVAAGSPAPARRGGRRRWRRSGAAALQRRAPRRRGCRLGGRSPPRRPSTAPPPRVDLAGYGGPADPDLDVVVDLHPDDVAARSNPVMKP